MKSVLGPRAHRLRRAWRRARRWALYLALAMFVVLAGLYGVARAYLPEIALRKAELEAFLTAQAGQPVRIDRLEAHWDGLHPGARVLGLDVLAPDGRAAVHLGEANLSLKLLPLIRGEMQIYRLVLARVALTLQRDDDGRVRLVGFERESAGGADGDKFTAWLFQQGQVAVHEGELHWIDRRDASGPVRLSEVELTLSNRGERHRLELSARFPRGMCEECAVTLDITGNPLAGPDWSGEIYLDARALDIAALPPIARERWPDAFRGRFAVRAWTDWEAGAPRAVRGEVSATGLQVPFPGSARPLQVERAAGDLLWRRRGAGWRLDLTRLTLGLRGAPWFADRLTLDYGEQQSTLRVKHVDLTDVSAFVASSGGEHPWVERWRELRPEGGVDDLEARVEGPLDAPRRFSVSADLANVGTAAYRQIPGVKGVSGRLAMSNDRGELEVDARDFVLDLPRVFPAPINARRARGTVQWARAQDAWRVDARGLEVQGEDGAGTGELRLDVPFERARSPYLKLRVDFRDGDGAHASRYYPVAHLPPRTRAWMESSFVGGYITRGYLVYDGAIREFPFKQGQGRFELRGHVRDATYRYLPGWTPITQAEADVAIDSADVRVSGRGRIGALATERVRVEVRAPAGGPRTVYVNGEVAGPVAETVRVLRAVEPQPGWRAAWPEGLRATGMGNLKLAIEIPLGRPGYLLHGSYSVDQGAFLLGTGAGAEALSGLVRFTEHGIESGDVAGRLFGGPLRFHAATENGAARIEARGEIQAAELVRGFAPFATRVSGALPWSLTLQGPAEAPQLRLDADLAALRSQLPAPVDRPLGMPGETLRVQTELSRADAHVVDVQAGSLLAGKLAFDREGERWMFARGQLDYGKRSNGLPRTPGLSLNANFESLDLDQWLPLFESGKPLGELPWIARLTGAVKRLDLSDRRWGRLNWDLHRTESGWQGTLDGEAAAGQVGYRPARDSGAPHFNLDLLFLRLPEPKQAEASRDADPGRLPAVDLKARAFEYRGQALGALDLSARPIEHGWRIARLQLQRPESSLTARGEWRASADRQSTEAHIEFHSRDMGDTLDGLGFKGQMRGGDVTLNARLSWPGSPGSPRLSGLDGTMAIAADKGRFLQLDPGAARLFGLLDLRSIGRYLTLDFTPAFGKGLVFEQIRGDIVIERGNAYTQNLNVKGPSLAMSVNGRLGLAAEDYDLVLEASPQMSDTLTLASWGIFGPHAAAAVLAVQKLFKKQIARTTRLTYAIKGPWERPTVKRLGKNEGATPPPNPGSPSRD